MMCQACGKKTATTHIKTIVNGKLTEYHLCSDCAKEKGYSHFMNDWNWNFGNMLGGFMSNVFDTEPVTRCKTCGSSFEEITESGKVGCADCYQTFRRKLVPVIQRIHGTTRHKGKAPGSSALRVMEQAHPMVPVEETLLEEKKRLLKQAVEAQDFEQAAVLRDEIKEMENNG
jgi:protein arginine kinase activator